MVDFYWANFKNVKQELIKTIASYHKQIAYTNENSGDEFKIMVSHNCKLSFFFLSKISFLDGNLIFFLNKKIFHSCQIDKEIVFS